MEGAKGRKSVTQMPVRASLLVMERKETQDNFIACAPLFCRTFTPQTRTEQFFPFSLKIFLFCLTFSTICADIFCYKLCNACYKLANTCYKLCNTCYKVCNKLFLIGKGKISGRKEELSWRKEKLSRRKKKRYKQGSLIAHKSFSKESCRKLPYIIECE